MVLLLFLAAGRPVRGSGYLTRGDANGSHEAIMAIASLRDKV
jgi:hypothetical protein